MRPSLKNLSRLRVLFRRDYSLCLYGIPYDMRPGQSPGDLWRAAHSTSGRINPIADWMWLGSPGWYGAMTEDEMSNVKRFLAKYVDFVPGGPFEWDVLPEKIRILIE